MILLLALIAFGCPGTDCSASAARGGTALAPACAACDTCSADHYGFPQCKYCTSSFCNNRGSCNSTSGSVRHSALICSALAFLCPFHRFCCLQNERCFRVRSACVCDPGFDPVYNCRDCLPNFYGLNCTGLHYGAVNLRSCLPLFPPWCVYMNVCACCHSLPGHCGGHSLLGTWDVQLRSVLNFTGFLHL